MNPSSPRRQRYRIIRPLLLAAAFGFFFASSLALTTESFARSAKASADTGFRTYEFKNGLHLVSMPSSKVPLVTIVLASKAGGMTETRDIDGLTHLWEHMFFKGNKTIPDQEAFNKRIRQLGIVYNGDTSAEKVRYYFTLPAGFLDEGLKFMADAIQTPLINGKELERERLVVLNEYDRGAADPSYRLRNAVRRILYGEHDYRRSAIGTRTVIEQATQEQLKRIQKEVFVPQNSAILVAGDYDEKEMVRLVSRYFSGWQNPEGWQPVVQPKFQKFPKNTRVVSTHPGARNVSLQLVFEGPRVRLQPKDTYIADVLISLLNLPTGQFYKTYTDSGLTVGSTLSYHTQAQAGELNLYAVLPAKNLTKVEKMLAAEPKKWLKPGYFTEEQLADVRRSLKISHLYERNKPSAYIKTLAFWWPIAGLDYYRGYLDGMTAVTLEDIRGFVKQYFIDKPMVTAVMLSPGDAKRTGEKDNTDSFLKKATTH